MSEQDDECRLRLALHHAGHSADPSTRVGSIIVGKDDMVWSSGFNHFPSKIAQTTERMNDRDTKIKLIVHAEMNAILRAARRGIPLDGTTLYLAATDDTGLVWGGPPCTRCAVEIIQAGITEIVSYPIKPIPSRWHEDLEFSRSVLAEAGIKYREIRYKSH